MKKKILIAYKLLPEGLQKLSERFQLIMPEKDVFSPKELMEQISDCEGLLSMFNLAVDKKLIDAARRLKIIANYGVGYNNIDVSYATERGIVVTNTPDPVIEPTAELAFALMLSVARRVSECDRKLRKKNAIEWGVLENLGIGLYGKKLGIIGMGRIGQAIAKRALASGMEIFYHNRNRLDKGIEQKYNVHYLSLEELLAVSDYVSLNMPLTDETHHLINRDTLALIKKGAVLINTARGPIVDEAALVESLQSGHLGGAGLDVFENEPVISPELLQMDNVVLSPHNGTATVDGRNAMSRYAGENIIRFFEGKEPLSRVN